MLQFLRELFGFADVLSVLNGCFYYRSLLTPVVVSVFARLPVSVRRLSIDSVDQAYRSFSCTPEYLGMAACYPPQFPWWNGCWDEYYLDGVASSSIHLCRNSAQRKYRPRSGTMRTVSLATYSRPSVRTFSNKIGLSNERTPQLSIKEWVGKKH